MKTDKSGLKKRIFSFGFALKGIFELIKSEPNARIHLVATFCAVATGFFLRISGIEWCAILIVISLVWATEAFNTVIEKLVDHLFPEYHETARVIKDIAAGAVLISAIIAIIVGLIVFLPKLMDYFCK
jgi:diacylglycerol kinase